MAIVKMSKFNLFSFDDQRDALLKKLQEFNYVHFNKVEDVDEKSEGVKEVDNGDKLFAIEENLTKINYVINLLEPYQKKLSTVEGLKIVPKSYTLKQLREFGSTYDFQKVYEGLKSLEDEKNDLLQEIQNLKGKIAELKPWEKIDIPLSDLRKLNRVEIFLGTVSVRFAEDFMTEVKSLPMVQVEEISQDGNNLYLAVICDLDQKEECLDVLRKNGFSSVEIKGNKLVRDEIKDLEAKVNESESKVNSITEEIGSNGKVLDDFKLGYEYFENEKQRIESTETFLKTESVDIIEGYVPTNMVSKFEGNVKDVVGDDYYLTVVPASSDDPDVPIILKNNSFVKAFESLTKMYSLPKYDEVDPTPLFTPFYWLFAGIMVGDAGYGLVVFLLTLIGLKAFNLPEEKRSMVKFINYLSISVIIWGLIFGSFFGFNLPVKILDPSTQYFEMIGLSLILGGIHLFFGLGIKAYINIKNGKPLDALFDVGFWYMAVIGVIVWIIFGSVKPNPTFANIGKWVFILGMIGIVCTGGRSEESVAGKIGWGVYSAYGITSYIGDFVSYLRLMALALSGAFIAVAVNLIVSMLFKGGILGIIVGIVVFVLFQAFNAFLCYLSAYVHTARLTYVELFNKFYEGGGKPFRNMIADSKYFNIKED